MPLNCLFHAHNAYASNINFVYSICCCVNKIKIKMNEMNEINEIFRVNVKKAERTLVPSSRTDFFVDMSGQISSRRR